MVARVLVFWISFTTQATFGACLAAISSWFRMASDGTEPVSVTTPFLVCA